MCSLRTLVGSLLLASLASVAWAQTLPPKPAVKPAAPQSAPVFGGLGTWETMQVQTAPLVFRGNGTLGLADAIKNWDTRVVTTGALTFRGNGTLGLADSIKNWDTRVFTTPPLIFRGNGKLSN